MMMHQATNHAAAYATMYDCFFTSCCSTLLLIHHLYDTPTAPGAAACAVVVVTLKCSNFDITATPEYMAATLHCCNTILHYHIIYYTTILEYSSTLLLLPLLYSCYKSIRKKS